MIRNISKEYLLRTTCVHSRPSWTFDDVLTSLPKADLGWVSVRDSRVNKPEWLYFHLLRLDSAPTTLLTLVRAPFPWPTFLLWVLNCADRRRWQLTACQDGHKRRQRQWNNQAKHRHDRQSKSPSLAKSKSMWPIRFNFPLPLPPSPFVFTCPSSLWRWKSRDDD